ncbi:glycoside hydrolase family 47 protein [Kitasatospora sp. McL0602]|uniref:glycoside hydrolase family 47 protein n=1 Tax=Kitasatospora sp. McL0602 TaxID=3439530 RepID=UPI003F89FA04
MRTPPLPGTVPLPRRRAVLGAAAVAGAAAAVGRPAHAAELPSDPAVAAEVVAEFQHAWDGYKTVAWGYDEVRPVSGTRRDFFATGHTFGLSIVEALDTLWLMGLDSEVALAADWIEQHLDPAVDTEVQVFEMVIRVVGGLLAGYLCTGRPALLTRCIQLADRLLPAFTSSPTGMPYRYVNLRTGAVSGNVSPLAEIGTNCLEFGLLTRLAKDDKYWLAAKRACWAVYNRRSSLGLLGTSLDVESGRWADTASCAPNPPVDSFYEYLWAGAELFGDQELGSMYRELTDAVLRYQLDRPNGHTTFRQVDCTSGELVGQSQSELGAFYAGLLGKGGDLPTGREYYRSWSQTLATYPVLPEMFDYQSGRITDARNELRPEYVNSSFDLWRLTGEAEFKQTGYQYLQGIEAHLRVPGGYTVATDVTTSPVRLGDLTPGYLFAENFKYLYLMFAATPRFDYRSGLLSTEGKLLRGAVR